MADSRGVGQSDEWYTPRYIFDAMAPVLFDVDVAGPRKKTHVPAAFVISERSLELEWRGTVWMNPPFGGRNGIRPWLEKFVAHGDGVALCLDRTSAPWFQWAGDRVDLMLFVSPKVAYERPDGTLGSSPGAGTVLMSMGGNGNMFLRRAAKTLGLLMRRED